MDVEPLRKRYFFQLNLCKIYKLNLNIIVYLYINLFFLPNSEFSTNEVKNEVSANYDKLKRDVDHYVIYAL